VNLNRCQIGDCRETLRTLPDGVFQTCVTSPPYWGLRQYLFEGAVVIRADLDNEKRAWLMRELESHGVRPK
jgi:DNA modification methylase